MSLSSYVKIFDDDDNLFPEQLAVDLLALYESQPRHERYDMGYRNCEVLAIRPHTRIPEEPAISSGVTGDAHVAGGADQEQKEPEENKVAKSSHSYLPIFERLRHSCQKTLQRYMQTAPHGSNLFQVRGMELPNLLSYNHLNPNDSFHAHIDAWDKSTATRGLSIIFYINDVHEGGHTVFHTIRDEQGQPLSVAPKRKRVVVFPAGYPFVHEGSKPISNKKHIVVSWLHFGDKGHPIATVPLFPDKK